MEMRVLGWVLVGEGFAQGGERVMMKEERMRWFGEEKEIVLEKAHPETFFDLLLARIFEHPTLSHVVSTGSCPSSPNPRTRWSRSFFLVDRV